MVLYACLVRALWFTLLPEGTINVTQHIDVDGRAGVACCGAVDRLLGGTHDAHLAE